jgi:hypothetical protein
MSNGLVKLFAAAAFVAGSLLAAQASAGGMCGDPAVTASDHPTSTIASTTPAPTTPASGG